MSAVVIGFAGWGCAVGGVQVAYDPKETTYERLLEVFFQHVDPTTLNRQGGDRGTQYRSAICYHNPHQREAAQKVRLLLQSTMV